MHLGRAGTWPLPTKPAQNLEMQIPSDSVPASHLLNVGAERTEGEPCGVQGGPTRLKAHPCPSWASPCTTKLQPLGLAQGLRCGRDGRPGAWQVCRDIGAPRAPHTDPASSPGTEAAPRAWGSLARGRGVREGSSMAIDASQRPGRKQNPRPRNRRCLCRKQPSPRARLVLVARKLPSGPRLELSGPSVRPGSGGAAPRTGHLPPLPLKRS